MAAAEKRDGPWGGAARKKRAAIEEGPVPAAEQERPNPPSEAPTVPAAGEVVDRANASPVACPGCGSNQCPAAGGTYRGKRHTLRYRVCRCTRRFRTRQPHAPGAMEELWP